MADTNFRSGEEKRVDIRTINALQTRELRASVLRPDLTPDMMEFMGDYASDTLHLGAFEHNRLVGIATIMHRAPEDYTGTQSNNLWLLRGMATLPEVRGRGYGAALIRAGCAYVARKDGIYLWCDARLKALGFYMSLGFAVRGNQFSLPFVGPHYRMWREITDDDQKASHYEY